MNKVLVILIVIFLFSGCASIKECAKEILGSSTKSLEEAREKGVSQTFDLDYASIFDKTIGILKGMNAYIHIRDRQKGVIVAMEFPGYTNTTDIGIFFTAIGSNQTKLEISSRSSGLLYYASDKIFSRLRKE
jgi:uncharacterized protein YceK